MKKKNLLALSILFFTVIVFQTLASNKTKESTKALTPVQNSRTQKHSLKSKDQNQTAENIQFNAQKKSLNPDNQRKKSVKSVITQSLKKLKNKRSTANKEALSDWEKINFISTPTNTIYEFKDNPKILLSLQKEEGVLIEERKDIALFYKKTEEEKAILLSSSKIQNLETSFSRIKNEEEVSLFHLKGSYITFQDQKIYYEEYQFYTNDISIYVLISLDEPIKEANNIESFIQKWVEVPSAPFSQKEKNIILFFIENQEIK